MGRDHLGNYPIVAGLGFSRGIMLLDDCEGVFTYFVDGTGGDDVHEYLAAAAWQGAAGLHLKTRTTNAAADDIIAIEKLFDYPETGLLVARLRVAPIAVAFVKTLKLQLNIDDGAQQYAAVLNLQVNAGTVAYLNSGGTYTAIAAMATTFVGGNWYTMELAIDCIAKTLLTARFNGLKVDLSAQGLYNSAATSGRGAYLILSCSSVGAVPAEIYADNIYVGEYQEA